MALDNNYNGLTTLKDWWGKVKANFTYLDNRISTIITTPAEGVSAQEIIDARKGELALGDKINAMDLEDSQIHDEIGTLSNLTTTEKTNLVGAVSEVKDELGSHEAENAIPLPKPSGGDDTSAIQAVADIAVATGRGICSPSDYHYIIDSQINLRYLKYVDIKGTITVNFDGIGVILGDSSASINNNHIYINKVTKAGIDEFNIPDTPLIRIVGLKKGYVHIEFCNYVQLYADTDDPTTTSTAFCRFDFGMINKIELNTNPTPSGSTTQWINENKFYCQRIYNITIDGTYNHNHNIFYSPSLEGTNQELIRFNKGHSNVILDCRLEGTGNTVYLGEETHSNIILQSWNTTALAVIAKPTPTITDHGVGNHVLRRDMLYREEKDILTINKNTLIFDSTAENGITSVVPGLNKLTVSASSSVWSTDLVPVVPGSIFEFISDATNWRMRYYVYDENKQLITGSDPGVLYGSSLNWNTAGYYMYGSNSRWNNVVVNSANVKYIKIEARSGNSPVPFEYLVVRAYLLKQTEQLTRTYFDTRTPLVLSAAPTTGFAKLGQTIAKTTGGVFVCTKSLERTLSVTASSGATNITVNDATGIENGDIVGILLDDGKTDWRVVAGLVDNTFNVTALSGQASSGNRIVFNKWV